MNRDDRARYPMPILRLLLLCLTLGAIYTLHAGVVHSGLLPTAATPQAQPLSQMPTGSPPSIFSPPAGPWAARILETAPAKALFTQNPQRTNLILLGLQVLTIFLFTAAVPVWRGEHRRIYRAIQSTPSSPAPPRTRSAGWRGFGFALSLAGIAATGALTFPSSGDVAGNLGGAPLPDWVRLLPILIGIAIFILLAVRHQQTTASAAFRRDDDIPVFPYRSFSWLLLILLGVVLLQSYFRGSVPQPVDALSLRHGYLLSLWAQGGELALHDKILLAPMWLPATLTSDWLQLGQWRALAATLATISGGWLLFAELFRRTPYLGEYGEPVEDDGALPTMLATTALAVSLIVLSAYQIPILLEPVALGMLALWLQLLGARMRNVLLLGLGGLLCGALLLYGRVGFLWLGLALFIWIGIRLVNPAWFAGRLLTARRSKRVLQLETGIGIGGLLWWGWGAVLAITASLIVRLADTTLPNSPGVGNFVTALWNRLADPLGNRANLPGWWAQLAAQDSGQSLILQNPLLSQSPAETFPGWGFTLFAFASLLDSYFLAPILLLGIGIMLAGMDHLPGWVGAGWLMIGLVLFGQMDVAQSDRLMWLVCLAPPMALTVGFALDRIRTAILLSAGTWPLQALVYGALGLLIASGAANSIGYIERMSSDGMVEGRLASHITLFEGAPALYILPAHLAAQTEQAGNPDTETSSTLSPRLHALFSIYRLPEAVLLHPEQPVTALTPGGTILVEPANAHPLGSLWDEINTPVPGQTIPEQTILRQTVRDLRGNPVLYLYRLPE